MTELHSRGGNLYGPRTLQANWYEDKEQKTLGTNDGFRCPEVAYREMMEEQVLYQGPEGDISMPANAFGAVTTQVLNAKFLDSLNCVRLDNCRRVLCRYNINPAARMTTTSMLMSHGEKRVYTGPACRHMLDSTNLREALNPRPTQLPESGFGAILPRHTSDLDLGVRYFDTTSRAHYDRKDGVRPMSPRGQSSRPSTHPVPLPHTVYDEDKGAFQDSGAGFSYDPSTNMNPMPFPSAKLDGGDPWGRTKQKKLTHFGRFHITSTSRIFVDARGVDPPRLGITIPGDTTMWARQEARAGTALTTGAAPSAAATAGGDGVGESSPAATAATAATAAAVAGTGGAVEASHRRRCVIAYAAKDNLTRRRGVHIWDDYEGRNLPSQ